jgi:hypothetical protein
MKGCTLLVRYSTYYGKFEFFLSGTRSVVADPWNYFSMENPVLVQVLPVVLVPGAHLGSGQGFKHVLVLFVEYLYK